MKFSWRALQLYIIMILTCSIASGCAQGERVSPTPDIRQAAAAQATAIVVQAEATALIMQAQTRAAVLLTPASSTQTVIQPGPTAVKSPPVENPGVLTSIPSPAASSAATPEPDGHLTRVVIVKVSISSETSMITIQFRAPYEMTRPWNQGNIYVQDETDNTLYNEVPVLPIIGPLINRPRQDWQYGYIMLTNTPPGLKTGALVTVVLGVFKQEHVLVEP
jgi:hypothetical protein